MDDWHGNFDAAPMSMSMEAWAAGTSNGVYRGKFAVDVRVDNVTEIVQSMTALRARSSPEETGVKRRTEQCASIV